MEYVWPAFASGAYCRDLLWYPKRVTEGQRLRAPYGALNYVLRTTPGLRVYLAVV